MPTGYTAKIYHRNGTGNPLLRAMNEAGIPWQVVRTWEGADRNFERALKNRKNAPQLCPICRFEGEKVKDRHVRIVKGLDYALEKSLIKTWHRDSSTKKQWRVNGLKFTTREVEAFLLGVWSQAITEQQNQDDDKNNGNAESGGTPLLEAESPA